MLQTKSACLLVVWLSSFSLNYADSRRISRAVLTIPMKCQNCSYADYPLYVAPPPPIPVPGYPVYGTGGPPPPALPSGYPGYVAPPYGANCSQYPPQWTAYAPPYSLGYQPEQNESASCSPFYIILVLVLLSSIAALL